MKTIRIHLGPVEEAMLLEVQKVNRDYRDIQGFVLGQIQQEYARLPKSQQKTSR